jgi:hypothetical protein
MMEWIESLPTAGSGLIVVGGFVLLTLIVGGLVRRFAPSDILSEHNDLAGFILAVVGVVYAVLLAFVAIGVWERFEAAENRTFEEAGELATVYRDAGAFPQQRPLIRSELSDYARELVTIEWQKMSFGEHSEKADETLEKVYAQVRDLPVSSWNLQNVQAQMLDAMQAATRYREDRISMYATGINKLVWFVLVVGAVVTVSFTYLFGFKIGIMQQLMIGLLGLMISLVLFLAVALDYPYRGAIQIRPEAFSALLETFRQIGTR